MLPLNPPDEFGSPYASTSAFACWAGLLAEPGARVATAELVAFREREAYWAGDWEAYDGELEDQVRLEREWRALRDYARTRGVGIVGDVPIYVAEGSCDHLGHPGSSSRSPSWWQAHRRTSSTRAGRTGATRSTTGRR